MVVILDRGASPPSQLPTAPFAPELLPVFQPLADLALEPAFRRVVELLPAKRFRKVVLARECVGHVVVVLVTLAVALAAHEAGRCVENRFRRDQRAALLGRR